MVPNIFEGMTLGGSLDALSYHAGFLPSEARLMPLSV